MTTLRLHLAQSMHYALFCTVTRSVKRTVLIPDTTHGSEKTRAIESLRRDLETKWEAERNRLTSRLTELQEEVRRKDEALIKAVNDAKSEGDEMVA